MSFFKKVLGCKSVFKKTLDRKSSEDKKLGIKIEEFSYRMAGIMGLSEEDVQEAMDLDVTWNVGRYVVYPQSRAWNGWKPMLEVLPTNVFESSNGSGVGWCNVPHSDLPVNWSYIPKGTCTKVLPSDEDQEDIIEILKSFVDEEEILN